MSEQFINLTSSNINEEHLCCAIADKKHQAGVSVKKDWLKERIAEGHAKGAGEKLDKWAPTRCNRNVLFEKRICA